MNLQFELKLHQISLKTQCMAHKAAKQIDIARNMIIETLKIAFYCLLTHKNTLFWAKNGIVILIITIELSEK